MNINIENLIVYEFKCPNCKKITECCYPQNAPRSEMEMINCCNTACGASFFYYWKEGILIDDRKNKLESNLFKRVES